VELTLDHTLITGNRAGEGGGLFSTYPVSQTATVIRGNAPDDRSGC
jgi:hypothetical protein